jgi:hypothetical protein
VSDNIDTLIATAHDWFRKRVRKLISTNAEFVQVRPLFL